MIIIADSGSTKTDWVAIQNRDANIRVETEGLNPYFKDSLEISKEIALHLMNKLPKVEPEAVYFYGAGCTLAKSRMVEEALEQHFDCEIFVGSDMLGAARALCGNSEGIACIMGTGSNSCYYDGKYIVSNVPPLGYILGDEGSGAALGKLFLANLFKNQFSRELGDAFSDHFNLSINTVIEQVYSRQDANKFLASFAPFIHSQLFREEVHTMVLNAFRNFIQMNLQQYPHYRSLPVHFVGSIAHYFKACLEAACRLERIRVGHIVHKPIEYLVRYHSSTFH